jgi:formate C-acetyltransferase
MEVKQFINGSWTKAINVRDFVFKNITPYYGTSTFLEGPTERTKTLWNTCKKAMAEERANSGVRKLDTETISTIDAFGPGFIDRKNEVIVGLQTDELLKRAMKPFGGFKVVEKALSEHGLKPSEKLTELFSKYVKTHNDGVFDAYNSEIKKYPLTGYFNWAARQLRQRTDNR